MSAVHSYVQNNHSRFLNELIEFLKIPSVSAQRKHREDCRKAADFIAEKLRVLELEVSLEETSGHPVVLAHSKVRDDRPTILIYGHYDVQPEDPIDLWHSSPFDPIIKDGNLYGRGSSDDKGQLYTHVKAVESLLKAEGDLPANLVFLVEGDEEGTNSNVDHFIANHRDQLRADVAIISDSCQYGPDMPAICYGLRGICGEEIRLDAAKQDMHSGSFGGAVPNPCNILCEIVAKLKDEKGRVAIPGFYDDVLPLEDWERKAFASLPWDDEQYRSELEIPGLAGEEGYTTIERKWARPTLDVNGIFGGYMGEGSKTIIPAWSGVKITMRLVPNQDLHTIDRLFREYVKQITPGSVKLTFVAHHGGGPVLVPRDSRFMEEAVEAMRYGFGRDPYFVREGGSIPVVTTIKKELGMNTLLLGFGLPDDNIHSPNEKLCVKDFERGILTSARFLQLCGGKK